MQSINIKADHPLPTIPEFEFVLDVDNLSSKINRIFYKSTGDCIIILNKGNAILLNEIKYKYIEFAKEEDIGLIFYWDEVEKEKATSDMRRRPGSNYYSNLLGLIVKKQALELAGPLDEKFETCYFFEEWIWRIKRVGFNVHHHIKNEKRLESPNSPRQINDYFPSAIADCLRWERKKSGPGGMFKAALKLTVENLRFPSIRNIPVIIRHFFRNIPWPDPQFSDFSNEDEKSSNYLTSKSFWNKHWTAFSIPCEPDLTYPSYRSYDKIFKRYLPVDPNYQAVEIGCCPGLWLVYLAKTFQYKPNGIEWLEAGIHLANKNLEAFGLKGDIIQGDFFKMPLAQNKYDCVISMGFIEHFTDMDITFDRHIEILKPGGTLILAVPNFRGLNYYLQKFFNCDFLNAHNCAIMKESYIGNMLDKRKMKKLFLGTVCGFDPLMINFSGKRNWLFQLFYMIFAKTVIALRRRLGFSDTINASWLSCAILAIYKKPD